jgi:hypothetical protein
MADLKFKRLQFAVVVLIIDTFFTCQTCMKTHLNCDRGIAPISKWRVRFCWRIFPSSKEKTQISDSSAEFNVFFLYFFSFTSVNTNCRPIIGGEIKRQPCRGSAIPWGSDDTTRIHLQSPVQRFAGEKVRGRRRMLLDVRRMCSLSGTTLSSVCVGCKYCIGLYMCCRLSLPFTWLSNFNIGARKEGSKCDGIEFPSDLAG